MKTKIFIKRPLLFALLFASVLLAGKLNSVAQESMRGDLVPEGYRVIEGDILVRIQRSPKGTFPVSPVSYWTGGNIPYQFASEVSVANRANMVAAMAEWEAVANVHFLERNGESDYVIIQNGNGNWSGLGRQGGVQYISIASWGTRFTIVHELGHTLGYHHEHTRADRDSYIQVNNANIQPDYQSQFTLNTEAYYYGPYDFDSLMHYDQCGFSIDCDPGFTCGCTHHVITVLPPNDTQWQSRIGQRTHLSHWDAAIMSFLYPQSNWRFVDQYSIGAEIGTFLSPYHSFATGKTNVPSGGTVVILQPGNYPAAGTHAKPMTIRASLGVVVLR